VWDFGSALQYRVAVEKRIAQSLNLGVTYGYSQVPLRWRPSASNPGTSCQATSPSCDATVDHTTIAVSLSSGTSYGLHQILNIAVGAVLFDNFREDATGQQLPPSSVDTDFFFTIGYGIGIGFSRRFSASIVQDYGFVVHQRSGLQGNFDAFQNVASFRLGLRVGLGG
jgi:hypothetical protein